MTVQPRRTLRAVAARLLTLCVCLSALQCGAGRASSRSASDDGAAMTPAAGVRLPGEHGASAADLSDAQIATALGVATSLEVTQASVALDRSRDTRVRQFAQTMLEEQGDARELQTQLAAKLALHSAESQLADELRTDYVNVLTILRGSDASEFDRSYVALEIGDQQRLLDLLDGELIPNADHPELRQMLQISRQLTAANLLRALMLQDVLQRETLGSRETRPTGAQ